jgi:FlaA1/EpsC-like NDP-sugar epimerase
MLLGRILEKLTARVKHGNIARYFRTRIVFALDVLMSLLSSVATLMLISLFLPNLQFSSEFILTWLIGSAVVTMVIELAVKSYRTIIRYSTLRELYPICMAVFGKEILLLFVMILVNVTYSFNFIGGMVLLDLPISVALLVAIRVGMVVCYDSIVRYINRGSERQRILVYGVEDKAASLVMRLQHSPHYDVCGYITPDDTLKGHKVGGYSIFSYADEKSLRDILAGNDVSGILFARENDAKAERDSLMEYCNNIGCKMYIVPSIDEVQEGNILDKAIRKIKIEDLLGRPEIEISMDVIVENFKGKTIMVTGAAGSIGSELCRQLATFGIKELVMFDNAETPLHNVRLEFEENYPNLKFIPIIGDVRLPQRLDYVFKTYKPDVVFHAAAYKHVPLMEENPCEAVLVNVAGSRNVADKCCEYGVEKMVMISTDKAVNPTNIMGCTKRLAEIYVQSLGLAIARGEKPGKTKFVTTRFGNVLGSNGSVIPHFNAQIAAGGPITVTHPDIVRYFMSIPEACCLVMEAAVVSEGNEICVFDMGKPVKIAYLAEQMVKLAGLKLGEDIEIVYTGLRPGEKLYEELLATKENTIPTKHDSIFIAKVRSYDYDDAAAVADKLKYYSEEVQIPEMVTLMKRTVPEFKSKNSPYEKYDIN